MRLSPWLACPLALVALSFAPAGVRADDPPKPAEPKAPGEFVEVMTEWKKVIKKKNDPQFAKERAAYYETKNFKGTGLFWLGCIWELAGDAPKAIENFEKFLKAPEGKEANKESAMMKTMALHSGTGSYEKALAMGDTVLKAYPMSNHAAQNVDDMGRIYRRWGKDDKALEKFLAAAEMKSSQGVFDAIDIYLVQGKIAEAKATLAKYGEMLKASTKGAREEMAEFLEAVGKPAPALEGCRSPTNTEVPAKFGGSWVLLYVGNMTMSGMERRLTRFATIAHGWEKTTPWFVISYDQFDPFTKKVNKELTPDAELEIQIKLFKEESGGAQVLTVTKELWNALHLKQPGQRVLIDPDGNFRWMRLTEQKGGYDPFTMEKALDAFAGKGSGEAAPAEGDGGGEPGGGEMPGGG
jgi:tetratricopeptide (TPR) repeat protein